MVKVNLYGIFVIIDFKDMTHEAVSVLILQWNDSIYIDMLIIKLSVDTENILGKIKDALSNVVTIGIILRKCEIECVTNSQRSNSILKAWDCHSKAAEETEWISC